MLVHLCQRSVVLVRHDACAAAACTRQMLEDRHRTIDKRNQILLRKMNEIFTAADKTQNDYKKHQRRCDQRVCVY